MTHICDYDFRDFQYFAGEDVTSLCPSILPSLGPVCKACNLLSGDIKDLCLQNPCDIVKKNEKEKCLIWIEKLIEEEAETLSYT